MDLRPPPAPAPASPRLTLPRLTLPRLLLAALGVIVAGVSLLGILLAGSARRAIVERSERERLAAAARIAERIGRELGEAEAVVADVEAAFAAGVVTAGDPAALEGPLYLDLLAHPTIAEVTFTRASREGAPAFQIALYRARPAATAGASPPPAAAGDPPGLPLDAIATRVLHGADGRFTGELRERAPGDGLLGGRRVALEAPPDPTSHPTFTTAVEPRFRGQALWSDLHYAERDQALPAAARRVLVGVQKALEDRAGALLGVVRVELHAATIDGLARARVDEGDPDDPHRVFLCDHRGRLLTRLDPTHPLVVDDGDLRVHPGRRDAVLTRALASPLLSLVGDERPALSEAFTAGGERQLLTLRALPGSQGWVLGLVVPEVRYTRDLRALVMRFAGVALVALALVGLMVALLVRSLRQGLAQLLGTTAHMRGFEFAPTPTAPRLAEIAEVADGLERAKTALRALARYVPVDLVRQLYARNLEPELGGELRTVTLLFTDIEGFTTLSERLEPDALARALGAYLDAMTRAIAATSGTIDKFIGDAVMAFWNAPLPVEDHAAQACRAVLACEEATRALYASAAWQGLPPLVTRYGLHTATVLVGHFGASERLSYTALGDGVNLASRIEGLGKAYGLTRLVSDEVVARVGGRFAVRRVDRVAVKGKSRPVMVHELLGAAPLPPTEATAAYERALDLYLARDFAAAITALAPHLEADPAARALAARCHLLQATPPPPDWDGTHVATTK